jgi:hypothetical protein
MPKQTRKPKPGWTVCQGCGATYKIGVPHAMFCAANTCEDCGGSYSGGIPKNEEGRRVCERCEADLLDDDRED